MNETIIIVSPTINFYKLSVFIGSSSIICHINVEVVVLLYSQVKMSLHTRRRIQKLQFEIYFNFIVTHLLYFHYSVLQYSLKNHNGLFEFLFLFYFELLLICPILFFNRHNSRRKRMIFIAPNVQNGQDIIVGQVNAAIVGF